MKTSFLACAGLALLAIYTIPGAAQPGPPVRRLELPAGARNPQVMARGERAWLVYVFQNDAYCRRSTDGGKFWTSPTRINSQPGCVSSGMERGPRIALGKDEALHVVWQPRWPPGGGQVWYSRSSDGAKFTPQRDIRQAQAGYDEPNIAADARGSVYASWLDGRLPERPDSPTASPLFMAESRDNGTTWGDAARIESDYPGNFCGCCMPALFLDARGQPCIAARGGYRSIRDIWLLRRAPDKSWKAVRVSYENWVLNGCPMSGPSVAQTPSGVSVAWMSQGKVYWNRSETNRQFSQKPLTLRAPASAAPDASQNYPLVLVNAQGIVCVAWNQGGRVFWKTYNSDLQDLSSGDLGAGIGSGMEAGRAAGFVTPQGDFRIVF
jgi:hypothetical protein